jgi:stage II sporulation protein D
MLSPVRSLMSLVIAMALVLGAFAGVPTAAAAQGGARQDSGGQDSDSQDSGGQDPGEQGAGEQGPGGVDASLVGAEFNEIAIRPRDGSTLLWNGKQYGGEMLVRSVDSGLVLIERIDIDTYLLGIQEVPFSWEADALKAQAVAARTYLAWTLSLGRNGAAATYGFDICATDQCQVYGGLDQVTGSSGERWADAVGETAGEILVYQGRPAQALYSSTSGGRTRDVRDVFGSSAVPYLQAVVSPGETSPFVEWTVELTGPQFERVLADADLVSGRLQDVRVERTGDGEGPWEVIVVSTGSSESLSTWRFRGAMNGSGNRVLPELLPADRPDGDRYPQTILSPTFTIDRTWDVGRDFTSGWVPATPVYAIEGNGWGHLVGMSQYGAQAMATSGSTYDDILAHYYGGLRPTDGAEALPDLVDVGLAWGESRLSITADGAYDVIADGVPIAEETVGRWEFVTAGELVVVAPPPGQGLPPVVRVDEAPLAVAAGAAVQVFADVSAAAETRLTVFRGPEVIAQTDWKLEDAGSIVFVWDAVVDGSVARSGVFRAVISARSPDGYGAAVVTIRIVP